MEWRVWGGGCAEGGEDRGGGRGDPYSHIISIKPKTMTCRYNESLTFDIVVSEEGTAVRRRGFVGSCSLGLLVRVVFSLAKVYIALHTAATRS